jgi:hypothetical protein
MAKAKKVVGKGLYQCKKIEVFEHPSGNFFLKIYGRVPGPRYKQIGGMVRAECSLGNSVPAVPPNNARVSLLGQIVDQALNTAQ